MKTSTLNPLASSFIPSGTKHSSEMVSIGKLSTKSMASKLIKDLMESKKADSEKSVTKEEIVAIVEKLISLRYKENLECDSLKSYLTNKVPNILTLKPLVAIKQQVKDPKVSAVATKVKEFDLSSFRAPKMSLLLVSFWGLYRQEQALRPMLSLTIRPENLEDKIWSVTSKDLKVWNRYAIESPCCCPPMFGYTVPADFFGNPFKVESKCTLKSVHLNHYPDSEYGNEFAEVNDGERRLVACSDVFSDLKEVCVEKDMDYYSEQFKSIVSGVCGLISEKSEYCEVSDIEGYPESLIADVPFNFVESLWDADPSSKRPTGDEIVEDDDCHPLLDALQAKAEENSNCEGVGLEIEEMIRKSLSTDPEEEPVPVKVAELEGKCDPPCSAWCHSSPKSTKRTSEVVSLLNETTEFLMNAEGCISSKRLTSKAFEAGLHQSQRPYLKRSFSANDCDSYEKCKMESIPQYSTSTREALEFLRKDPLNFFTQLNDRNNSWKDNDSGIVSEYSSQEDVFYSDDQLLEDGSTPMWNFFSGEGSMWKPLPSSQNEQAKFPYKRVRELRRQRSLN